MLKRTMRTTQKKWISQSISKMFARLMTSLAYTMTTDKSQVGSDVCLSVWAKVGYLDSKCLEKMYGKGVMFELLSMPTLCFPLLHVGWSKLY